MKTLILIVDREAGRPAPLDYVDALGPTHWTDETRKVATSGDHWLAVGRSDRMSADYEPEDLERIDRRASDVAFFGVESNSEAMMARYLSSLPAGPGVFVDNDHGWIAPIGSYQGAIARGARWLYADDAPAMESHGA